jgi:PAS domain S-box-containing protein
MDDRMNIIAMLVCLAALANLFLFGALAYLFLVENVQSDLIVFVPMVIMALGVAPMALVYRYRYLLKRATQQMHEAEAQSLHLRALFDNAPVEMYLKDLEGRYLHINAQFEKLFDVKNENVIGVLPDRVHYEALAKSTREHDLEVINSGKVVVREAYSETAQGLRYLQTIKFPISGPDGQMTSIGAVVTDVTPMREMTELLKNTNRQMNAILENAPVGIFLKDKEGNFTLTNPAICQFIGGTKEQILGRKIEDLYNGEQLQKFQCTDRQVYSTKMPISYESRTIAPGRILDVKIYKFPIFDELGEVVGLGGIEVDITEHKHIQRELLIAKEQADQANRSKSDFLANMSHEIRTPLNAILGFSEILSSEVFGPIGSERYKVYARDIFQSGSHLLDLISDILDLSKIEAGRLDLAEDVLDLKEAVGGSLNVVSNIASEKGVKLAVSTTIRAVVSADRRAVHQVLINLLSNAVKFTPSKGEVVMSVKDQSDGTLTIMVHDTGIGIPDKDLESVFEVFTQLKSSNTSDHSGSGIGLAIVKQLCDAMGWSIDLQSELGKGTLVSLTLPASSVIKSNSET